MNLVKDAAGNVTGVELTREEWKKKHKDFKDGRYGKDARCLVLVDGVGTCSVPVIPVKA